MQKLKLPINFQQSKLLPWENLAEVVFEKSTELTQDLMIFLQQKHVLYNSKSFERLWN